MCETLAHYWQADILLFISSLLTLEFEFLLGSKSPELMSIFHFFSPVLLTHGIFFLLALVGIILF